ncbi:MAG: helix-turn-helix transcriptional regulator [Clostridiales bacterium]|nr:helix-turn-helix transcriptional regulator [Clostridiales bacterium]
MISYEPLWKTLKEKGITQYQLINTYKISAGQLSRLRSNNHVSTHTLDRLCEILDCNLEDVATYHKD